MDRIKSKQNQNSTMWKSSVHHIWGPRWSRGFHWAALLSSSVHSTDSWPCRLLSTAVALRHLSRICNIPKPDCSLVNTPPGLSSGTLTLARGMKPQHLTMVPSSWASLEDVPLPMASPGFSQHEAISYSYKTPSVLSTVKYTLDHLWVTAFVCWHRGNTPRRMDLNGAGL